MELKENERKNIFTTELERFIYLKAPFCFVLFFSSFSFLFLLFFSDLFDVGAQLLHYQFYFYCCFPCFTHHLLFDFFFLSLSFLSMLLIVCACVCMKQVKEREKNRVTDMEYIDRKPNDFVFQFFLNDQTC